MSIELFPGNPSSQHIVVLGYIGRGRINSSTGKPCNTIFSRPYDLTGHEDTIHNARKQKVHCPRCTRGGKKQTFLRIFTKRYILPATNKKIAPEKKKCTA
jgi:hypothetical protein